MPGDTITLSIPPAWRQVARYLGHRDVRSWIRDVGGDIVEVRPLRFVPVLPLQWRQETFKARRTTDGESFAFHEVLGLISGPFGIYAGQSFIPSDQRREHVFTLAHVPTGERLATLDKVKRCKWLAEELLPHAMLSCMDSTIDWTGRLGNIKNLPLNKPLHPLFESISNAFHAIEDIGLRSGFIEIEIVRSADGLLGPDGIDGFVVHDNGIGFTDANFRSFCRSDSTYKKKRGGKGIGRLLWLKAFTSVTVVSRFMQGDFLVQRSFSFGLPGGPSGGDEILPVDDGAPGTSITLAGLLPEYQKRCPRSAETIGNRIAEHFALLFISDACPKVVLVDGVDKYSVNAARSKLLERQGRAVPISIAGNDFRLSHFHNYGRAEQGEHEIWFCGDGRVVKQLKLRNVLPSTPARRILDGAGHDFLYVGIVSGDLLDQSISSERLDFTLDDEEPDLPDVFSLAALTRAVGQRVDHYLAPHLKPLREENRQKVAQFVREKAPQYTPILRDAKAIATLPADFDDTKLDQLLRGIQFRKEMELSERAQVIAKKPKPTSVEDFEEYKAAIVQFVEEENEYGKSNLARYVVHRKVVIELLDKLLGQNEEGEFALEEVIHKIISPMQVTSDDVEYTKHNLWLVDERLTFHEFMASNRKFREGKKGTHKAPDILIFDVGLAFSDADPASSIVIIEFKRPQRDDYKPNDNPIDQVLEYVVSMQENQWVDSRGREIRVNANTQYYCYLLCDLKPSIVREAMKRGWTATPDQQGYYHYSNPNVYQELISYRKLLGDSRKRNRVLFKSLGLEG